MQNTASASRLAEEDGVKLGEPEVELLRTCRSDAACTRSDNGLQMAALAVVIQRLGGHGYPVRRPLLRLASLITGRTMQGPEAQRTLRQVMQHDWMRYITLLHAEDFLA